MHGRVVHEVWPSGQMVRKAALTALTILMLNCDRYITYNGNAIL